MNYLMVDISGKVLNYDIALCEALFKNVSKKDQLKLFAANIDPSKIECPSKKMLSLVPKSLQNSRNKIKRSVKILEGIVNYLYLIIYVLFCRVNVLHLQWLPFLEVSSIEKVFLKLIRLASPKTQIILTVHNLYPHNFSDKRKEGYRKRFDEIKNLIDVFILHLECSKTDFCEQFGVSPSRVKVIPHGIFMPKGMTIEPHKRGEKLNLIMYGNQSFYKGTDILVDALNLLPQNCQDKVHTVIVGKIAPDYYGPLKKKTELLDVEWIPEFVPDDVLYNKISESDIIVIPYREISQSGVLLLALYFEKIIIVSDLLSFKETLEGCSSNLFFESENPQNLSLKLSGLIDNVSLWDEYLLQLKKVKKSNLWENSAKRTFECYKEFV